MFPITHSEGAQQNANKHGAETLLQTKPPDCNRIARPTRHTSLLWTSLRVISRIKKRTRARGGLKNIFDILKDKLLGGTGIYDRRVVAAEL